MLISEGPFSGLVRHGYGFIEADPAWGWLSYSGKRSAPHRTGDEPYPTMTIEELRALPVQDIAAKDCMLNMWVIGSHLDQAIDLAVNHWGFTFRSDGFVWVKTGKNDPAVRPIGMGKWVRKQVEYSLLFGRGKPSRTDAGVRQLIETGDNVIYAPKREHSRKPDERYDRIERLVAGPYVELFARTARPNWSAWGNDTGRWGERDSFDSLSACSVGFESSAFPLCSTIDDFDGLLA